MASRVVDPRATFRAIALAPPPARSPRPAAQSRKPPTGVARGAGGPAWQAGLQALDRLTSVDFEATSRPLHPPRSAPQRPAAPRSAPQCPVALPPPPPPPLVLSGHAASLTPYQSDTPLTLRRGARRQGLEGMRSADVQALVCGEPGSRVFVAVERRRVDQVTGAAAVEEITVQLSRALPAGGGSGGGGGGGAANRDAAQLRRQDSTVRLPPSAEGRGVSD